MDPIAIATQEKPKDTQVTALTYADLFDLPDDNHRYELIGGDLYVSPAPGRQHQRALARLFLLFHEIVVRLDLGEVFLAPFDVKLSEYDVVDPDLFVVLKPRLHIVDVKYVTEPPDLVVEIISPSSRRQDQARKLALYAAWGVPEYWLADPVRKQLTIFTLVNGRYEVLTAPGQPVKSKILPDLVIDLDALFANL